MGVITHASQLHEKNDQLAKQDIVLICSGQSFQYISLSSFVSSGEIVFVAAPDSEKSFTEFDCPTDNSLDNKHSLGVFEPIGFTYTKVSLCKIIGRNALAFIHQQYSPSLARAPPSIV